MATSAFRAYLRSASASVLIFVSLAAAVNAVVDPYGMFDTPLIPGINAIKVRADQQREIYKSVGVVRARPKILILGNSRAEIGFDPQSTAWPPHRGAVYNLALAGSNLQMAARMLSTATAVSPPELIVLGLDFPDFLRDPSVAPLAPLPIGADQARQVAASEYASSLLSLDTLLNSLETIAAQRDPYAARLTRLGFNPLNEYIPISRRQGFHALFSQKNAEYARRYTKGPLVLYPRITGRSPDADQLREMLLFCCKQHIAVKLVIYPYHAQLLEIFAAAGLYPTYEEWKRLLVRTVEAEVTPEFRPELWDFSGYSAYTTEPVPSADDRRSVMRWFWESGHFRPEFGKLIIRDLFAAQPLIGRQLTSANVEAHLAEIRSQREMYRAAQPDVISEILTLTAKRGA